ncbi:MAG: DUF1929 domain-containing protein [Mojavia pulchra JT2-VF2]|uniref:DUF1929 domain-containing protein n=1 Tax=Mojavia pulchra JT2-VF2 TaxID=287848 RepID=A0A951UID1_9NOST|nr:DUF1929 domain-containing protein [Mojavia pulchra JT2-VF2]
MRRLFRPQQLLSLVFALITVIVILSGVSTKQFVLAQSGTNPALVGSWAGPYPWPLVPIHASVGPNGKVIAWQRPKLAPANTPQSIVWDPNTKAFTSVPTVATDIFCAGHAFAPSGRLLVAGGHEGSPTPDPNQQADIGSNDSNVYDFNTNSWFSYIDKMNKGRWYPTVTYLGNGEAAVVAGTNNDEQDIVTIPEVWTSGATYRSLTAAPQKLDNYPWGFVAPSGRVFYSGPNRTTRVLNTVGTGQWSTVSNSNLGDRFYGSSVMYDNGRVLIVGGGLEKYSGLPTNTAEVIDVAVSNQWIPVPSMAFRRRHHNATLLPDGKIIVTGGTSGSGFNTAIENGVDRTVLPAEMWDPATKQWSTMASMKVGRFYHSFAALLPDGRVLVGGGGLPLAAGEPSDGNDPKNQGHYDVEIYSPPYLFAGMRPTIASAPTSVSYSQQFAVNTPDAANITSVSWIRLSSVTHGFNENQRINRLNYTKTAGSLNVTAPSDRNLCPPGHYMLFILNNGVPSVAKIVQIS